MAFIKSIDINQFRGIGSLEVSDFSNVNILVGDNNSGKTTFLEAVQLLFTKAQLNSIKNVISQRTALSSNQTAFYTSFIKLFNNNQDPDHLELDIFAQSNTGTLRFELSGNESDISGDEAFRLSSLSAQQKTQLKKSLGGIPDSVKLFSGKIITEENKKVKENKIKCISISDDISGPVIKKEVYYLPSYGHLKFDLLQNIVDNPDYKKLVIDILRQFDDSIEDICYTKADDGSFMESIITKDGINMPFSVYGDGIKKILYILNKLFDATDSVLLIDEIETGLHKKYYDLLFPVIFALAKQLNVQLFIATHSIEAIDAILRYGNYEENTGEDFIRVITLKKIKSDNEISNIVARNITGKYVYENRKVFEFEVRL